MVLNSPIPLSSWFLMREPCFLAKLATSLHKPDGLAIDHTNVLEVYQRVSLLDLSGINTRFQARLNAYGIFTPIEFYNAPLEKLKNRFGNTYALQNKLVREEN